MNLEITSAMKMVNTLQGGGTSNQDVECRWRITSTSNPANIYWIPSTGWTAVGGGQGGIWSIGPTAIPADAPSPATYTLFARFVGGTGKSESRDVT